MKVYLADSRVLIPLENNNSEGYACVYDKSTSVSQNDAIEAAWDYVTNKEGTMENKMNENSRDEEDEVLDCISELFSLKNLLIAMFIALLGCVYIAYEIHAINTGGFSVVGSFLGWLFSLMDTY